jgi:LAS superfamily LD-carboxypeptidase LdcB
VPSLRTLDPRFRPFAEALLAYARKLDPRFVITSARRTKTEQARLYSKWLRGLSPFPALPPGRSSHELGMAVDMARLNVDAATDPLLPALGRAWQEAGGSWAGPGDPVHFAAPPSWWK